MAKLDPTVTAVAAAAIAAIVTSVTLQEGSMTLQLEDAAATPVP